MQITHTWRNPDMCGTEPNPLMPPTPAEALYHRSAALCAYIGGTAAGAALPQSLCQSGSPARLANPARQPGTRAADPQPPHRRFKFDDIGWSILCLFEMASQESWSDVMYATAAAIDVGAPPPFF